MSPNANQTDTLFNKNNSTRESKRWKIFKNNSASVSMAHGKIKNIESFNTLHLLEQFKKKIKNMIDTNQKNQQ